MSPSGLRSISWAALALVLGSPAAWAAGLSAEQAATVLGQPLNFPVQVRLDAGESLTADCINAEVHVSDQRLPPSAVRTQIDQQGNGLARVRVQTQQAIDEPVVSITLRVGCSAPITRRFVVFADPPFTAVTAASTAPPAAALPLASANPPAGAAPAAQGTADPTRTAASQPDAAGRVVAGEATRAARPTGDAGKTASRNADRSATQVARQAPASGVAQRSSSPAAPRPAAGAPARPAADKAPAVANAAAPAVTGPRLSLEPVVPMAVKSTQAASPSGSVRAEPTTSARADLGSTRAESDAIAQAMEAVAQAASAARVAALAASASADRMASLERTVAQMRSESQANQALIAELRQRLDQAPGANPWLWPLLAVAAALAVLSGWLSWRLGRAQTLRQQAWVQQRQAGAVSALQSTGHGMESQAERMSRARTGPAPFMTTDLPTFPPRSGLGSVQGPAAALAAASKVVPSQTPASLRGTPPSIPGHATEGDRTGHADGAEGAQTDSAMARTEPMPGPLRGGKEGVRDVSIEELIDLEQQAEFFVVLGQDDAAIDLLVDHLRSTGGGSPLPYLKLLEIYSRTNDRSAYERNRARFNHRFNAYAPEWGSDLAHGRALEDYPGILPRLEQVWPRPLDAMAELEALLFRKSRGELFELPAYREVLFLYALARDLLDHGAVDTGTVDLLLPLSDGSSFGTTAPIPFLHDETRAADSEFDSDDPPTRPVDFDLTIPAQQTSMFDPMDDPPHLSPLWRR